MKKGLMGPFLFCGRWKELAALAIHASVVLKSIPGRWPFYTESGHRGTGKNTGPGKPDGPDIFQRRTGT
jgi:hypothetical protein